MKIKTILSCAAFAVLTFSGSAATFETHKKEMLKDSSLIRYYTFEEGYGEEVANHVILEPGRIAQSGGPLGSLTINLATPYSVIKYGQTYSERLSADRNPRWTRGRFPGKAALRSGGLPLGFFRSGITGREFQNGMTLSGWIRTGDEIGRSSLLQLADAWSRGFRLSHTRNAPEQKGSFEFRIGNKGKTILSAPSALPGVWVHFAVTVGNGKAKLFVNGHLEAEKEFSGAIPPGIVNDLPSLRPFFENFSGHGTSLEPLLISANPRSENQRPAPRIDWDELAICNRPLSEQEILALYTSGKPAENELSQRNAYATLRKAELLEDQIQMTIPADTDGYFRFGKPIPATVSVPEAVRNASKAVFELETLSGKKIWTKEQNVSAGQTVTVPLNFPECNVYWLDMKLLASDGSVLKQIPYKYCIAIAPPAPAKLSDRNPIAYWADWYDHFHFDSPLRRMQYHGNGKHFESLYAEYAKRIPDFRSYLWFYSVCTKPPKEGWEAGRERNRKLFTEAAKRFQGKKIIAFEMTSEPHNIDPKWYVQHLADARKIFSESGLRQPMIPPGGAPPSIPMISDILKAGGEKYMDGISYHPYTVKPIDALNSDDSLNRLHAVMAEYPGKKFILWNTESGINALPRIKYRPMTASDAHAARMPGRDGAFLGFITMLEESEAAARQVQHALVCLAQGYRIYTICQSPNLNGDPSLRGLAMTVLAGQILNNQTGVRRLPLARLDNVCLLIKQADGSSTAAIFSRNPDRLLLHLAPDTEYRIMDMLGNLSRRRTDKEGILSIRSSSHPQYIFSVPDTLSEITPLTMNLPAVMPERGPLKGTLTLSNPFRSGTLKGTLEAIPVRGAEIALSETRINLPPGASRTLEITITGKNLKRQMYTFSVQLKNEEGKLLASASRQAQSPGVIRMIPRVRGAMPLDGKLEKWKNVPAIVCDSVDSVVHGKPNYAEIWIPQWLGKQDLSFSLKCVWRKNDAVYFLLNVTDDVLLPAPEDKVGLAFRYDCLELFFDSRPVKQQGTVLSDGADQAIIIPRSTREITPCELWFARKERAHVKIECVGRKTADGWMLEGKIIPTAQSAFQVRAGSQFRMDFLVDDTDKDDPKWLRKSAMALDGIFSNSQNSNVWGRYELSLDTVK